MSSKETVFITGATGYIALWIIDILLSKGYPVIGSVRSSTKGDSISQNFAHSRPGSQFSYVVVSDFNREDAFDSALSSHPEIKYVLHTASPVTPVEGSIEDTFLNPALYGTLNVLKSIKAHAPQVTKVVLTSSLASMLNLSLPNDAYVITEESWNPITREEITRENAYYASKTFAEKAAWKFVEEETPNFSLTVVCPPYVFGPQLFDEALANDSLNFSTEVLTGLLRTTPDDDEADYSLVAVAINVRDIALYHVLPLENDSLVGERLLPIAGHFSRQWFLNFLNDKFPELKGKIARGHPEKADELVKVRYDVSKTLKLGGFDLISIDDTIVETINQVLDYRKAH